MENQQFKKLIKEALTPNFLKESVHYRLKLLQKVEDADEKISMDKRANREWLKALDDDEISFSHYSDDELEQLLGIAQQIMKDHSMSYIPESISDMSSDSSIPEEKFRNGVVGAMMKVDELLDTINYFTQPEYGDWGGDKELKLEDDMMAARKALDDYLRR